MSAALDDLLRSMREHPAFGELLDALNPPQLTLYSPNKDKDSATQGADWIFGSGQHRQHMRWREFLTSYVSPALAAENQPSHKE